MEGVTIQEILRLLGPNSGNPLWNIMLYAIFIFALLTMVSIPDKNMVSTLLMAGVLLAAVVAKLSISSSPPILRKREFGMLIINIVMFVFPLLAAGLIRSRKKGRAMLFGIITGLIGGGYFFFFWFMEQAN